YTDLLAYKQENCVEILNPLSNDLNVMRQTLIFSGLEAISLNINFQNANLRLFEYGRCYKLTGKPGEGLKPYGEDMRFAIFSTGNRDANSWAVKERKSDFYELKAYAEAFITKLGVDVEQFSVEPLEDNDLFSGGVALKRNGKTIVETGVVSEDVLRKFDIKQEVFASEIYWSELIKLVDKPARFKELPKQFKIRRDLALLINEDVKFEEIKKIAFQTEKQLLTEVGLFDYYKGKGVPDGKKSYGVCFYLIDEQKTLTDKVIDKTMNKLIQRYQKEFNAELR
ncbi:MAG: phenylalanine--tRNA ligase subunit beta, partial [Bacteroidales bacterium]|nr:phenylalanine--tRNA ligase subunit beta [Bacteroidales bacterium]